MNNDQHLRGAQAAAMIEYLQYVGEHQTDEGFRFAIGIPVSAFELQQLRSAAMIGNMISQTREGLELTPSGRASLNSVASL